MIIKDGILIKVEESDIVDGVFDEWESSIEKIGNNAFSDLQSLCRIIIPYGVTSIGDNAFSSCLNLREVYMSDSVQKIGESAFSECSSLETIELSDSLIYISDDMFKDCVNLNNITLPSKIKKIGCYAFANCGKISRIIIPNSVTEINESAFSSCESLHNIKLSKNLRRIGSNAFYECTSIEEIELPSKLRLIPSQLFYNCKELEKIILPSCLNEIGSFAFEGCTKLKDVELPAGLTNIGNGAFNDCKSLKYISIPDKINSLGDYTFAYCTNLERVTLPEGLKNIGNSVFLETSIETIEIPEKLESIEDYAFSTCKKLTEIYIPNNCSVGPTAFEYCSKLKKIKCGDKDFNLNDYKLLFMNEKNNNTSIFISLIAKLNGEYNLKHDIKFPNTFLELLDKENVSKLLMNDNVKHFKDIYAKYIEKMNYRSDDLRDFYKFAYCLGCFDNKEEVIDGRVVNISQKASVFLKELLDKELLYIDECHDLFDGLKICEYDVDLLKFITLLDKEEIQNKVGYNNFLYLKDKRKTISKIINNFKEVKQQIVVDDHGRVLMQASYKRRIETYLKNTTFENVELGNEDLVEEFIKFHSISQYNFEEAQSIRKEGETAPHHIVKEHLKEPSIIEAIKMLQDKIGDKIIIAKELLDELYEKEFTYEWLDKHDPKNFTLGLYCDCCASIVSAYYGKVIMENSITRDDVQNLVVKNNEGKIIAKATIYVNKEKGYAVFNDIEMNREYGDEVNELDYSDNEKRLKIYKAFKRGVRDFIEKYNEIYKDKPLTQVNIGWGYNRLKQVIRMLEEESEKVLDVIDSFEDAKEEQWVIYKKHK